MYSISLLNPGGLKPHEKISILKFLIVLVKILIVGAFTKPVIVDKKSKATLDGHPRVAVANFFEVQSYSGNAS